MPLYYFNLDDGYQGIVDPEGTDLADESAARAHAVTVAQEIMAHAEAKTRHWLINVCDRDKERLFEVLFVTVDPTISHIRPEARRHIEESCVARRSLGRAAREAHATACRARAAIARSQGLPWLALVEGPAPAVVSPPPRLPTTSRHSGATSDFEHSETPPVSNARSI
jgi:hypothetical protein